MPNSNTKIKLKRSTRTFDELTLDTAEVIDYGEPIFINPDSNNKNKYLVIGNSGEEGKIEDATVFEGITDTSLLGRTVFANTNNVAVIQGGETGIPVSVTKVSPVEITTASAGSDTKYYLLSCASTLEETGKSIYVHKYNKDNNNSNNGVAFGIYISSNGVLHGGAWNDYAEQRVCINGKPGQVVCETGLGVLDLSEFKLHPLPYVISDTYGIIIGAADENSCPVAVSGRVLVYVDGEVSVGDVLCAGPKGFATKMTRQEIINYPDRILGIVSEIPTYNTWNDKEVDGRVWITIK